MLPRGGRRRRGLELTVAACLAVAGLLVLSRSMAPGHLVASRASSSSTMDASVGAGLPEPGEQPEDTVHYADAGELLLSRLGHEAVDLRAGWSCRDITDPGWEGSCGTAMLADGVAVVWVLEERPTSGASLPTWRLPHMPFHTTRHTAMLLMILAKTDPRTASERMGHHSVGFTFDKYGHVIAAMREGTARGVRGVLLAAAGPGLEPPPDSGSNSVSNSVSGAPPDAIPAAV